MKRLEERLKELEERLSNEERLNLVQRVKLGAWIVIIATVLGGGITVAWDIVKGQIVDSVEAADE